MQDAPKIVISSIEKEDQFETLEDGWQWRCGQCGGDLFGIVKDGVLQIKYRDREMALIGGSITAHCRKCRCSSTIDFRKGQIETAIVYGENQLDVLASKAAAELAAESGISLADVIPADGRKVNISDIRGHIEKVSDNTTKKEGGIEASADLTEEN